MGDWYRAHAQPDAEKAIDAQIAASCTTPELTHTKLGT